MFTQNIEILVFLGLSTLLLAQGLIVLDFSLYSINKFTPANMA